MIQGSRTRKAIPLDEADIYILVSGIILCNIWPTYITAKAEELKAYCINNGYNADYGILVDYGMHSFQKRLFVYDFNKEKVILKSLCASGAGGESTIKRRLQHYS